MTRHYPGSREHNHKRLTGRGYRREQDRVWRETIPPESTAPPVLNDGVKDSQPALADWGVTVEQARDMLHRQMCPVCGQGPWKSPLNHAARKHGIDRFTMRDLCGLTVRESVAEPTLSKVFAEHSRARDMTPAMEASLRRKAQRWTTTGRARNAQTLKDWELAHPDEARDARRRAGLAGAAAKRAKTRETS